MRRVIRCVEVCEGSKWFIYYAFDKKDEPICVGDELITFQKEEGTEFVTWRMVGVATEVSGDCVEIDEQDERVALCNIAWQLKNIDAIIDETTRRKADLRSGQLSFL